MKRLNNPEFKNKGLSPIIKKIELLSREIKEIKKRQEYLEDIILDYDDIIAIEEARRDKKENRLVSLEEVEKELMTK